jgi:hypothetical protein
VLSTKKLRAGRISMERSTKLKRAKSETVKCFALYSHIRFEGTAIIDPIIELDGSSQHIGPITSLIAKGKLAKAAL